MRVRRGSSTVVTVAAFAAGVTLLAAAGWAYWTSAGNATGAATTASLQAVEVTGAGAAPSSALLPGRSAGAAFRVTNPNHFAVTITSVTASGSVSASGGTGCDDTDAQVAFVDQYDLDITVPADAVDHLVRLADDAVTMGAGAANGCQSATFLLPITVHAQTP